MTKEPWMDEEKAEAEAISAFEREIGVTGIAVKKELAGNHEFLKFVVGREGPLYTHALLQAQKVLSPENPFRGAMGLVLERTETFPNSFEAGALLTLLTRSTREVSQDRRSSGYTVPFIPFHNREDHQLAQPASHIVRGRRGVGKSTLIRRAVELLSTSPALFAVLDMQSYCALAGEELIREVFYDICRLLAESARQVSTKYKLPIESPKLSIMAEEILSGNLPIARAPVALKRILGEITQITKDHIYVFLDDYHLIIHDAQPKLLHVLHGALKGINGWLKVAGLSSLLNQYSQATREGLQVPGDAQFISLDLTLENPEAAEAHLKSILEKFLAAVGHAVSQAVIPDIAFKRLAWATAGVPRDFLQMFARAIEHARKDRHVAVTLSDINIVIGEFGQQKMDDLNRDARNKANTLTSFLKQLEELCLDEKKVNAFLVRSEDSLERDLVRVLSDLRMVHLIHQSITPNRAGERYEAFILDYSIFTGFRRRRGIREMVPEERQFKAGELRALPRVDAGFFQKDEDSSD